MDFKRIQIIFLITFVVIDIFLFSLFRRNQDVQIENMHANDSTSIVSEMRNDQISFTHKPSSKTGMGYYLAAKRTGDLNSHIQRLDNQNAHYSNERLQSTFKRPINLGNHPVQTINQTIGDPTFVSFGKHYQYSSSLSTPNTLVYIQREAGKDIYAHSAEIRFHLSGDMLESYTQSYASKVQNLRERSDTISSEKALTNLYQYNDIPNNTKVKWCHFVYTKLLSVKGNDIYIPTWVVKMKINNESGYQYRMVNAFSGTILKR